MPPTATGVCNDGMPALFLVRHGPTAWTASRRLQGRSDIPLSAAGRSAVTETAAILRGNHCPTGELLIEPRLTEMSFGEWEGQTLPALRAIHGAAMAEREGRGLDFRAPGGESPRDVQDRLRPWLEELSALQEAVLAITHKGVVRALYALAEGWDMREKPRHRLLDNAAHEFEVDRTGIRIRDLNIALRPPLDRAEASA